MPSKHANTKLSHVIRNTILRTKLVVIGAVHSVPITTNILNHFELHLLHGLTTGVGTGPIQ